MHFITDQAHFSLISIDILILINQIGRRKREVWDQLEQKGIKEIGEWKSGTLTCVSFACPFLQCECFCPIEAEWLKWPTTTLVTSMYYKPSHWHCKQKGIFKSLLLHFSWALSYVLFPISLMDYILLLRIISFYYYYVALFFHLFQILYYLGTFYCLERFLSSCKEQIAS